MTAEWQITGKSPPSRNDVHAYMTYGTSRANAYRILEDTLNLRDVRIYDTVQDADGKEQRVLNKKRLPSHSRSSRPSRMRSRTGFGKTLAATELVEKYNELFNSIRPREYDGSHIRFGGMNPEITGCVNISRMPLLMCCTAANTLLAHEVGAGQDLRDGRICYGGKTAGAEPEIHVCRSESLDPSVGK